MYLILGLSVNCLSIFFQFLWMTLLLFSILYCYLGYHYQFIFLHLWHAHLSYLRTLPCLEHLIFMSTTPTCTQTPMVIRYLSACTYHFFCCIWEFVEKCIYLVVVRCTLKFFSVTALCWELAIQGKHLKNIWRQQKGKYLHAFHQNQMGIYILVMLR